MKHTLVSLLLLLISLITPFTSYAQSGHLHLGGLSDVETEIEELKKKIAETQSKERSLSSEIGVMDNKIKLATLKLSETSAKIKTLGEEIQELGGKIENLETKLSRLSELLMDRIATSYKVSRTSYMPLLFSSQGLNDLLVRTKYVQRAQENDRQVFTEVQLTKDNFTEQKHLRETKKTQQEELKKQLETQQQELASQKKTKQTLLTQTKNDEATYQKLLQQALAEKQAIEAALINGVKEGPVKTGDPIALVGNTGYPACSTGAHLHFEVRKDNRWVSPVDYLKPKEVTDSQNGGKTTIGNGNWEWPLSSDVILTQHYGHTPYSWRYSYSGGIHTGFDMYSNATSVIRAPKDGTLYSSSQNCGGSSVIKIKYIEHGDGLVSFYLHVQ